MPRLFILDSGIGGLSVTRPIRALLPDAEIVYVADDAWFPWGDLDEPVLVRRVVDIVEAALGAFSPDVVVIACNTASTLVLPHLRARFDRPFVGTVPAIKPAAERTASGLVSVLATPGTMARDYTRDLIRKFAPQCQVRLVGSGMLAPLAEAEMAGTPAADTEILAEIMPAFVEQDGRRTDTVVLACTHYPFLLDRFRALAPWPVNWIDPAPAIARQVVAVLGEASGAKGLGNRAYFTSGRQDHPAAGLFYDLGLDLAAAPGLFDPTPQPS